MSTLRGLSPALKRPFHELLSFKLQESIRVIDKNSNSIANILIDLHNRRTKRDGKKTRVSERWNRIERTIFFSFRNYEKYFCIYVNKYTYDSFNIISRFLYYRIFIKYCLDISLFIRKYKQLTYC